MNKAQLLALDKLADHPLTVVEQQNPELFNQLATQIATDRKTILDAAFLGSSPRLQEVVKNIEPAMLRQSKKSIAEATTEALNGRLATPELAREAADRLLDLDRSGRLSDPIDISRPIKEHPAFQQDLQRAQIVKLTDLTDLADAKAIKLADAFDSPANLNDERLKHLVDTQLLSQQEAKAVGLSTSLFHLLDDSLPLTKTIVRGNVPGVTNGRVDELRDLVALEDKEWIDLMTRAQIQPPVGHDAASYAAEMRQRTAKLYPTDAFVSRTTLRVKTDVAQSVDRLTPLANLNPNLFEHAFEDLKIDGLTPQQIDVMKADHGEVRGLILTHPGLKLEEVFAANATPADKAGMVQKRLGLVKKAYEQNPEAEFLTLDYSPDSKEVDQLKFDGFSPEEKNMVLSNFKAAQRTFQLTDDADHAHVLLKAGYHTATSIASENYEDFQKATGLTDALAEKFYLRARNKLGELTTLVGSLIDLNRGWFDRLPIGNLLPSVHDYLKKLPGYADLFGSQDFCHCEHCQSILSPAAYFVDLMRFVEQNVLEKYFSGARAGHVLNLKTRRPDLWTLPLTCENTYTLVPYLDIINEILEGYIAKANGVADVSDRAAVENKVYRDLLSKSVDSFVQPFVLPVARIVAYLSHFEYSRGKVALTLRLKDARLAAVQLEASPLQYQLITTANADLAFLRRIYGLAFPAQANGAVAPVNAQQMLRKIGLSRSELGDLLSSKFVNSGGGAAVVIRAEKASAASVQNDVENVHNLTLAALDRAHRLARLRRHLGWTLSETDLAVTALGGLDDAHARRIVRVLAVSTRFGISAEQTLALFGPVPSVAVHAETPSLFDRLFNPPAFKFAERFPADATTFVHPAFRPANAPIQVADPVHRLQVGLQVDSERLAQLIDGLSTPLAAGAADKGFKLTAANLSLLYRHAELARHLQRTPPELFQIIKLAGIAGGHVASLDSLDALLSFNDYLQTGGHAADDLAFLLGYVPLRPDLYADAAAVTAQVISEGAAAGDPSRVLLGRIANKLALDVDKAGALATLGAINLGDAALVASLTGGPAAPLQAAIAKIARLGVLFKSKSFDAAAIAFVGQNRAMFGLNDLNALTVASAQSLSIYARVADTVADEGFSAGETPFDPVDVRTVLTGFTAAQGFAGVDRKVLARALRTDATLLATVRPVVALSNSAPEALGELQKAAQLAAFFGVGGDVLAGLTSEDYAELTKAADALIGAYRTKYPDEKQFNEKLDPYLNRVRSRRRDALADYLVRSVGRAFEDLSDLYQYFLVDVQLEGCARTSRVVAAVSSLQLYVHRILMNLEQDDRAVGDLRKVHVLPHAIPAGEWEWRKNYRVWEANRKVFLFPESYIEPELRDDKTPLFKELEDELLQKEISDLTVLDAYSKYLTGFEEVARLQLAGCFHDRTSEEGTDVLHLFGVTAADPPVFYYRTVDNPYHGERDGRKGVTFNPWKKIEVQIPVRKVSPIVHLGRLFVFWAEITTSPRNKVADGGSQFVGYKHRLVVKYTTLRPDGTWTTPQPIDMGNSESAFGGSTTVNVGGFIDDPLMEEAEKNAIDTAVRSFNLLELVNAVIKAQTPRYDTKPHGEPIDTYTLSGFQWDQVYPGVKPNGELVLACCNFGTSAEVDFYQRKLKNVYSLAMREGNTNPSICSRKSNIGGRNARRLYYGTKDALLLEQYAQASIAADSRRIDLMRSSRTAWLANWIETGLYREAIAEIPDATDIQIVNGSCSDAFLAVENDLLYIQGTAGAFFGPRFVLRRFSTTLTEQLVRTLFAGGVDALLDTDTQESLKEAPLSATSLSSRINNRGNAGRLDFTGAYGTYYRELFFHVPFLIANQLNAQGKYADAQQWYHYIFNPTATPPPAAHGATAADKARAERDRVWRYLEFRGLDIPKMRQVLTDPAAIEVYKKDPFNPHAIARLRLSAYQKCIVMKYIDNLLDWGDSLFTRFTMESVNEATMLYVMAADILGPRPAELGSCGEGKVQPKTYEKIAPLVKKGSEFLAELETIRIVPRPGRFSIPIKIKPNFVLDKAVIRVNSDKLFTRPVAVTVQPPADPRRNLAIEPGREINAGRALAAAPRFLEAKGNRLQFVPGRFGKIDRTIGHVSPLIPGFERVPNFGWSIIRQFSPVFCVPENKELRQYWDRVEDRLYKIRNCLDITGVRRPLALFAPEIDPRLLVRAKAAGLSIDDILAATAGPLPAYRFLYLVERAKQYAATVQSFGAGLLSAIEKRDAEQLNRLRTVQQQHILKLTAKVREWEIKIAEDSIEQLNRQKNAIEYRKGFYQGLVEGGLTGWERTQQVSRHIASGLQVLAGVTDVVASIAHLVPEVGSPFAMKYGGLQLGNSASSWSTVARDAAGAAEAIAASAGLEAANQRREEGWKHQVDLAAHELKQLDKQISAAEIRRDIAVRSLELHQKAVEQLEEVFEFFRDRFTNLGLYTYLASTMQRLYREAYQGAMSAARMAEQAYRYERDDDVTPLIEPNYWDPTRAGLLAGESLMLDLQAMERRFCETNVRTEEIDLPFSLSQIAPAALMALRESGECTFELPEFFFDLFYPGQYRRRTRYVRLTIPCVTGPYTNVSATLTMTASKVRRDPKTGDTELKDVPLRGITTVSTSTAQADAGVFEFSFRDERYLPFEGTGAVSEWRLALPKAFRPFDYQTVNDVIVHVGYVALRDELFRQQVEQKTGQVEAELVRVLKAKSLGRVISLRQDLSSALHRLMVSPAGTAVTVAVTDKYLPIFFRGRTVQVQKASLVLRLPPAQTVAGFNLQVNGAAVNAFTKDAALGNLFAKDTTPIFAQGFNKDYSLTVTAAGDLAPASQQPGNPILVDPDKLLDLMIYLEYRLTN